jgi:hypothetical protein
MHNKVFCWCSSKLSNALPLLRSELTKDEMQAQLASRARILFWGSVVLGTLSVCLVGHAIYRYLSRTHCAKQWILQKFLCSSILCHFLYHLSYADCYLISSRDHPFEQFRFLQPVFDTF